jgi:hypothetical protein
MPIDSRNFTLEEARVLLKKMLPELSSLVSLKKILDAKHYDIYRHEYFGGSGPNGTKHYPPELDELVEILSRFAAKNILVKSLDEGLIDFPHVRDNGEEVYLCYKLGEEDLMFWHSLESGFAGRKSTTQL